MKELSIYELNQKLQSAEIKSADLVSYYQSKIAESDLNAVLNTDCHAIEHASLLEKKDFENSYLAGIPYLSKALISRKDFECNAASKMLHNFKPASSATVIENLDKAKAIFMGNCNMDEFAQGSSNEYSAYGACLNPWDDSRVPGGSSGGSAAAVAANLAPFALGTDTGGSIRQPAAFCGVVGLKPSYGRISRSGVMSYASSLDTVGALCRTVDDAAIILESIASKDFRDSTTTKSKVLKYYELLKKTPSKQKFAYVKEFFESDALDNNIRRETLRFFEEIRKEGHEVEEISVREFLFANAAYYIIAKSEGSSNYGRYDGIRYGHSSEFSKNSDEVFEKSRAESFGDEVKRCIMLGAYTLSASHIDTYYFKASRVRRLIKNAFDKIFNEYDALLSPVSPSLPFKLGSIKNPVEMYLADTYTTPMSLAGVPSISIPVSLIDKLPFAIQVSTEIYTEEKTLICASILEKIASFKPLS